MSTPIHNVIALFGILVILTLLTQFVNSPAFNPEKYRVYHRPTEDLMFELYIKDIERGIEINLSDRSCFKDLMPEALTGGTGRRLNVAMADNRLVVEDSYWGTRCELGKSH